MWWDRFKRRQASAWLGERRLAWTGPGAEGVRVAATEGVADSLAQLKSWHQAAGRPALELVLEGGLCRLRAMTPVPGAQGFAEIQAVLNAAAQGQSDRQLLDHGLEGPVWWFLELAPELRASLHAALGGKLVSLRPWWWGHMNLHEGCHAAFDGRTLSYCWAGQGAEAPLAGEIGPLADLDAAQRWLQRQKLGTERGPIRLVWLDWAGSATQASVAAAENFPFKDWLREAVI